MIRGDDDVFSIMNQMSGMDDKSKIHNDIDHKTSSSSSSSFCKTKQRIRMVPEIEGYGNQNQSCLGYGKDGDMMDIWNPYAAVDLDGASIDSSSDCIPPTNPYVEVCRRRSYEKFKKKFYASFNWITSNASNPRNDAKDKKSKTDDVVPSTLWGKLPPHSILERFYFACKINEMFQVMDSRKGRDTILMPKRSEVGKIASLLSVERDQGLIIDPILLSPFNVYRSSYQMLRNEIEFQFTREWKKATKVSEMKKIKEFFSSQSFQKRCTKICRAINELGVEVSREFVEELRKKARELSISSSGTKRKGKKKTNVPKLSFERQQEKDGTGFVESFSLTFSGLSFRISKKHYEKLQVLFDRFNVESCSLVEHQDSFYCAMFALLARYDLLEGAGLQSSINGNVFDVLLKHFDCCMECFASPFNSRYTRYCSAYPDTDRPFGSLGSFFNFDFKAIKAGGSFQANPPFASDFILAMCNCMEKLLKDDSVTAPFMFVVFVPAWQDSQGWQALSKATSLVYHLFLSQKDDPHYYTEGTQHRRLKGRYRIASFDTSVFFLQNIAAKKKWPITEGMLTELKDAFGINPEEKSEKRMIQRQKSIDTTKPRKGASIPTNGEVDKNVKKRKPEEMEKCQGKPKDKGKKKKKNLVADDSQSQLDILASLAIPAAAAEHAAKTTKIAKMIKEKDQKHGKRKGKKNRKKR